MFSVSGNDHPPCGLPIIWLVAVGDLPLTWVQISNRFQTSYRPWADINDRITVILEQEDWPIWLGEVEGAPADLLRPAGDDLLRIWPLSRAVDSPRNEGPELLEPVG